MFRQVITGGRTVKKTGTDVVGEAGRSASITKEALWVSQARHAVSTVTSMSNESPGETIPDWKSRVNQGATEVT